MCFGNRPLVLTALLLLLSTSGLCRRADAALTFTVGGSWPDEGRRTAAVNAMTAVVDRYNAYGNFGNHNIYVYYDAGIPTAQASYLGSIGFGGTFPNERVALHEAAHYLGLPSSGWNTLMAGGTWSGPRGTQIVKQFDGEQAPLNGDSAHFWPYGLNLDNEGSEINKQRHVAVVYAMRADLGIGPSQHPSTATTVALTSSDALGESGFNYQGRWSDGYFAHSGADYFTGDFAIRTPTSTNSFRFAGDSLRINNTNGPSGGLFYKGQGTTGVITVDNLILDGGWVQHLKGLADVFRLDGNVNVLGASTIAATQGTIDVLADLSGAGNLTIAPIAPSGTTDKFVLLRSSNNDFVGNIINQGRFELAEGANFKFLIGSPETSNAITGASALATRMNGTFDIDLSGASTNPGDSWELVTAANTTYGPSFNVAGFANSAGSWSNNSYVFDQATGILSVLPAATHWAVDGGATWSSPSHWDSGVPTPMGSAVLGSSLSESQAPAMVELDTPANLRRITFDSPNRYVVAGSNSLTLTGLAEVVATEGSHEIAVVLAGDSGLNFTGPGRVALSAANTYSGATHIKSGRLTLSGAGTISQSKKVEVHASATLDVTAASGGSYEFTDQELDVDGQVVGNVIATHNTVVRLNTLESIDGSLRLETGSRALGEGSLRGDLVANDGTMLEVGSQALQFRSTRTVIDDFSGYSIGAVRDVASPPWTAHGAGAGTQFAAIETDAGNNALSFGWSNGARGTSRDLPPETVIDNADTATFFFRFNSKTDDPDHNFGLSDQVNTLADADFAEFEAQFRIVQGTTPGTIAVNARNGATFTGNLATGLPINTWHNVWLVVNQATDRYDVYMNTGTGDATPAHRLNTTPLAFRNGTTSSLTKILGLAGAAPMDYGVRFDDLVYFEGINLANPLGSTPPVYVGESQVFMVDGNLSLELGSTLALDIATPSIRDQLVVTGHMHAEGTLSLLLADGAPQPKLGDVFNILNVGTSSGSFSGFELPDLPSGLVWNLTNLMTAGDLSVALDADLDNDGDVDGRDFLAIQRNNPSLIGAWQELYGGRVYVPPLSSVSAMPEPSSLLLLLATAALWYQPRSRRH